VNDYGVARAGMGRFYVISLVPTLNIFVRA
jgi:hypothetical protein